MNLEINVSCPNTEHSLIDKDINLFLNPKRKWCIIKLSPLIDKNIQIFIINKDVDNLIVEILYQLKKVG